MNIERKNNEVVHILTLSTEELKVLYYSISTDRNRFDSDEQQSIALRIDEMIADAL